MLENFQLAAIVKEVGQVKVLQIPMHRALQETLSTTWQGQLDGFLHGVQEVVFNAGYQLEEHERFALEGFEPPKWLANETSASVGDLDSINTDETIVSAIRGIIGFARNQSGKELVLFQSFSRSHVIRPGNFILFRNGTYETTEGHGLTLESKLCAAYFPAEQKLLFRNFRAVNTFLPLADFYEEASEQQIRQVLAHKMLAPENVDALATESNQWFRKRFALLRDSGVLDQYSAKQIQARSKGYDLEICISKGKIVFPEARPAAKKLLQFLNEELFRGPITETLYETNSKREAD